MNKSVGHLKVRSFYTGLLEKKKPDLRGYPVVIVGSYQQRAPILALSDEAARLGVFRGQPLSKVLSRFPEVKIELANRPLYLAGLRQLEKTLHRYTPVFEASGYSSGYLDLSGTGRLWGKGRDVLFKIGKEVISDLGLPIISGLAVNKLVSKLATDTAGQHHESLIEVLEGDESVFVRPHGVHVIPETTEEIITRLRDLNLMTLGDLQSIQLPYLTQLFGSTGLRTHKYAFGHDERPVIPHKDADNLIEKIIFHEPTNDGSVLRGRLFGAIHQICYVLRKRGLVTRKLRLAVQFADHQTIFRQISIADGTQLEHPLYAAIEPLLSAVLIRRVQIGLMTLTAEKLTLKDEQLVFWDDRVVTREEKLFTALDRLETKYGKNLVSFAWTGLPKDSPPSGRLS